jgi:ankyrin repeat protein
MSSQEQQVSEQEPVSQDVVEPFVIAAHGNFAKVQELYEQHPEALNVPWAKFDETALQASSHMGQREIAHYLLSKGAPLTICAAAMLGMQDEVAAFLKQDASLANARGAHGIPVLFHAAMSGQTQVAELLLARGGGEGINTALHGAVNFGHIEMVKWLLAHGVTNVNAPNYEQKTPLQVATELGHTDIAEVLRAHGGTLS